jgi:carbamoyltransferase
LFKLLDGCVERTGIDLQNWQNRIAKAMQSIAEKIVWHVLEDLWEKTQCENVVLSGGFFMNSVLNGKVTDRTPFKNVYISHSPDDAGNSIGAALYVNHCILNQPRVKNINASSAIGPSFTDKQVKEALERRVINYTLLESPEKSVAEILSSGEVVALHQGRMEFGDRALGFRSILGDPRQANMKDKINSMIKYRESYRPFAPSTLTEKAKEIFDVPDNYLCPYMEKVVKVREEWKEKIPAVTHFDGSARLQTVESIENPYYYRVIEEFGKITGIPVVLNTSFNINGEPIVLTPDDAISTFFNSGLEYLVIGTYLIQKSNQ